MMSSEVTDVKLHCSASCEHNCTWMELSSHLLQHKQPLPHCMEIRGFGKQLVSQPESHSGDFKGKKSLSLGYPGSGAGLEKQSGSRQF